MFNIVNPSPAYDPLMDRLEVKGSRDFREHSPMLAALSSVSNHTYERHKSNKTMTGRTAEFLRQAWQRLLTSVSGQSSEENRDIGEETELAEILTKGEALRREAEYYLFADKEEQVPRAWKGSPLKRYLTGFGLLTGALDRAGYTRDKYYQKWNPYKGTTVDPIQLWPSYAHPASVKIYDGDIDLSVIDEQITVGMLTEMHKQLKNTPATEGDQQDIYYGFDLKSLETPQYLSHEILLRKKRDVEENEPFEINSEYGSDELKQKKANYDASFKTSVISPRITNEITLYGMYDRQICTVLWDEEKCELIVDLTTKTPHTGYNNKLYAMIILRDENGLLKYKLPIYGNKNKLSNTKYALDAGSTIEIYHNEPSRSKMNDEVINGSRTVNVFRVTDKGLEVIEETLQMKSYRSQTHEIRESGEGGLIDKISNAQKADALKWWLTYKWKGGDIKPEGAPNYPEEGAAYIAGKSHVICINGLLWKLHYDNKRNIFEIENTMKERIIITYDENINPICNSDDNVNEYMDFVNEERNKKVISELKVLNNERVRLLDSIGFNEGEVNKIKNRKVTFLYYGHDPEIADVNKNIVRKFNKKKEADIKKVAGLISCLKSEIEVCEKKMIDVLHPALEWFLISEMDKNQYHIESETKPVQGMIIEKDRKKYIYLSGFFWLVSYKSQSENYVISSGSDKVKVKKISNKYVIDHNDNGLSLYLNKLNGMQAEHRKNLSEIDKLYCNDIAMYFGKDWKDGVYGKPSKNEHYINFDTKRMIDEISNQDLFVQAEFFKIVSLPHLFDTETIEINGYNVEQFINLAQIIHQYASGKNISDKSRLAASNFLSKLLKFARIHEGAGLACFVVDYLTVIDAKENVIPGDELYYDALGMYLFGIPGAFTEGERRLQNQERYLVKAISLKENCKMQGNQLVPKMELSMHIVTKKRYEDEILDKNKKLQDEIDNLTILLEEVRLNIEKLKNDKSSPLKFTDMINFMHQLYSVRTDESTMQDFTQKILMSNRLLSEGKDTESAILRSKARYIQELIDQSKLYNRLCGLFNQSDLVKKITRYYDFRDIESAISLAGGFIIETKGVNPDEIIHLQAIFYYIVRHGITNTSVLLNVNPQHFYVEYINDMMKFYPIKINEHPDGYFSRLAFFHRTQFSSQFDFNEQFHIYKKKYANYEASIIARTLFQLIHNAPLASELYKKPNWVKEFHSIVNKNDSIYVFSLEDDKFLVVSCVSNAFFAKIHRGKVLPSFFLINPLEINVKGSYKTGFSWQDVRSNAILSSDELNSFQKELRNFMLVHQGIQFDDSINVQGDTFETNGKNIADSLVSAIEHAISSFTDTQKMVLDETGIMHYLAKMVIPFYDVIYTSLNDNGHQWDFRDTLSIMNDIISLLFVCAESGVKISSAVIKDSTAAAIGEYAAGHSRSIRLINAARKSNILKSNKDIAKIIASDAVEFILNPLPFSPRDAFSFSRGGNDGSMFSMPKRASVNTKYAAYNIGGDSVNFISLRPMENQKYNNRDIFKNVYFNDADGSYYISSNSQLYQVRWSDVENTWRIVDPADSGVYHWTPAVRLDNNSEWNLNFSVDLKGGLGENTLPETAKELRNLSEWSRFNKLSEKEKKADSIKLIKSKHSQYEYFFDVSGSKQRLNIVGHGNRHAMRFKGDFKDATEYSPQELATLILPFVKDHDVVQIRLISCWAGKTGYAQQLANSLKIPVKAPMGKVATLEVMPGRYWFLNKPFNAAYPDMHEWRVFRAGISN